MTTATPALSGDKTSLTRSLMLIDGRHVESADGRAIDVENPATRTTIAQVLAAASPMCRELWMLPRARSSQAPVPARARPIAVADCRRCRAGGESIARIVALETGNALRTQARPEVKAAVDVFRYYGGVASEAKGETIPLGEHVLCYTPRTDRRRRRHRAVECAGRPRNAQDCDGDAAGNTLVLKAAEDAPLGLLRVRRSAASISPPAFSTW